jgi:hypothetical protein
MSATTAPRSHRAPSASEDGQVEEGSNALSLEGVAYWLIVAAIYVGFGFLWYYAAKEKLIDDSGTMPGPLAEGFSGSLIDSVPGLNASWVLLGALEAVVFLGFVASIVTGEFLPTRRKPILVGSLGLSLLTFAVLIFGQTMIGEHESVAELFGYFGATIVTLLLVLILPPRRGLRWLTQD